MRVKLSAALHIMILAVQLRTSSHNYFLSGVVHLSDMTSIIMFVGWRLSARVKCLPLIIVYCGHPLIKLVFALLKLGLL